MKTLIVNQNVIVSIFAAILFIGSAQGMSYAQGVNPTITASVQQPLTEANLHGSVVTLTLKGRTWERFEVHIGNALDVSGIPGLKISTFGPAWFGVDRISDTQITVELGFEGDFDTTSILTFTVGADAIAEYKGPALTAQISVTASMETDPPEDEQDTPGADPEAKETSAADDYLQGPWLWMIAEGSDIDADYLSTLSNGEVSEAFIAINGVRSGDTLGDLQWTPEVIPSSVHCEIEWVFIIPVHRCKSNNVQHVVNATGLSAVQDLNYYTAYAFMNIISPQNQAVKMGVGSDDAIKVWLNGGVVHRNDANRKTSGIQDTFRVNLKAGSNPLLVKVNDNRENWGMFFKIYLEPTEFETSIYMMDGLPSSAADVNEDGQVDIHDLILVIKALDETGNTRADVNSDGKVDKLDLLIIVENLEDSAIPAAPISRALLATLGPATLQAWMNLLHTEDDGSIASRQALAILQQFLVVKLPEQTVLLPNFPNPFNPETWIPYELAKPTEVTITIYASNGQSVRTLALGHQPAGMYQNRSRAAYWDGRNAFGEPVASGVYFYTLTADDFSATGKMLIRK